MALLNHEETIAFLTQKEIQDAFWMRPQKRCVTSVKFKCDSCWTETQITDPRFATEVMKKKSRKSKMPDLWRNNEMHKLRCNSEGLVCLNLQLAGWSA